MVRLVDMAPSIRGVLGLLYPTKYGLIFLIVLLALVLRLALVPYGLPLFLVNDEPSTVLGALKMLSLKTVLPAAHLEDFKSVLYYPPYLSYLYLPFFAVITGIQYISWSGGAALFEAHLLSDLSQYFVAARLVSIVLALVSIVLVYLIAQALFRSRAAALAAAFLLATSALHIALSSVARHWVPVSFIFLLILYLLTKEGAREERSIGYGLIISGLGAGVSVISILGAIPVGLYWFLKGTMTFKELLRSRFLWLSAVAAAGLALLPSFLYPQGNGFLADTTLTAHKSLASLLTVPYSMISLTLFSEPVLTALFLGGLVLLWKTSRRDVLFFTLWPLLYATIFFIFFRFEARFFLPLIPMYALLGGYCISRFPAKSAGIALAAMLLFQPLVASIQLARLALQGDTRTLAKNWVLEHAAPEEKVLVYANLMRIPTRKESVEELSRIEPTALRKTEEADITLDRNNVPFSLNLYTVSDDDFFAMLPRYAKERGYDYLVLEPNYLGTINRMRAFSALASEGKVVASWEGLGDKTSLDGDRFLEPFTRFFSGALFGPNIVVYKLQ